MPEDLAKAAARAGADELSQAMGQAAAAMSAERNAGRIEGGSVRGGLVEFSDVNRLAVISDLHGDAQTLYKILDRIGNCCTTGHG